MWFINEAQDVRAGWNTGGNRRAFEELAQTADPPLGLLAGGAVTFAIMTNKADDDLDKELNKYPFDQAKVDDARDKLKRNALITDGFTAASVISAGLFVYFTISTSKSSSADNKTTTTANVRIAPSPTSLHVLGNF